jgi:hypothetical protein
MSMVTDNNSKLGEDDDMMTVNRILTYDVSTIYAKNLLTVVF